MKDLKEFILEKRVKEWQIGSKKVPQLYIHCLNDYLEQIAEALADHDKELKDHIYDLNNKLLNLQLFLKDLRDSFHKSDETYEEIDKKLKELGGGDA